MDVDGFDALTRSLFSTPSRRHLLHSLAGVGLWIGGWKGSVGVEGKKRKRKKRKSSKPKLNEFGCLSVGQPCRNADLCCTGICEGKKGKRTCRAPGAGTCRPQMGFCTEPDPGLVPCNNVISCWCFRTTADSIFCGDLEGKTECSNCQKDADCLALGFPAGSACLPVAEGACTGACESGMMCMAPCTRGQDPGAA